MNGTDMNDTSLKTRYPKLSSDTDSTIPGGLTLEKSIVDPTCGFENCRNLSTFRCSWLRIYFLKKTCLDVMLVSKKSVGFQDTKKGTQDVRIPV